MPEPRNEQLVNYLDILDTEGRKYTTGKDNRWGGLVLPAPHENPGKTTEGLKIVLFASWKFGWVVLETLKKIESRYPDRLNLVGLVTDNPLNPDARISKKKRIWSALDLPIQVVDETSIIESGLCNGIPVYTGEIKIDSFRNLLKKWSPDAILVCVFGQIIDPFIINLPPYGIYNFHPSDLANNLGAGPDPVRCLQETNAETMRWTIHHVDENLDSGHIVGQSPPVRVRDVAGMVPDDRLVIFDKAMEALSPLAFAMVEELCSRFEKKQPGTIDFIDFESRISTGIKQKLLLPVTNNKPDETLPDPDDPVFISI